MHTRRQGTFAKIAKDYLISRVWNFQVKTYVLLSKPSMFSLKILKTISFPY